MEWTDNETDYTRQIEIVDAMVSRRVDALAISATEERALVAPHERAIRAGIPVTIFDSAVGIDNYVSFVATDNYGAGCTAARTLAALISGKGDVGMVMQKPGGTSTVLRERAFAETMSREFPGVNIVARQFGMADPARSRAVAENILTSHPDLVGLFASSEAASIGSIQAVRSRNLSGKMKLVTFDFSDIHVEARQAAGYAMTQVEALYRTIEDRFHALPGVVKVGLATYTPMEENNWGTGVKIQGEPDPDKGASWVKATAEYFDSVGTHVVMGRGFSTRDTLKAPPVAVVNQEFVKQFFGARNPIGHRFGFPNPGKDGAYEIVGVVEDTTYTSVYWQNHAVYFVPLTQRPANSDDPVEKDLSMYAGAIVVQTSRPENNMEKLARGTLAGINPNLTIVKFQTFQQQIDARFTEERLVARLTSLFGALALLLAALGLYGVITYTVVRRTPEIGIRMALGAERSRVIAMVMRGTMLQALLGLLIGAPVAMFCVRYVKSQLYEISSVNITVIVAATATLAVSAAIAGIIPARRAASINPGGVEGWMNHFGKGLRKDKFHCALKGINVMLMPLAMARNPHPSIA